MVCMTVLKLCKRYSLNFKTTLIEVTDEASMVNGTSANLREGDHLAIWDLLHGLMLPSGNDAGYLLAEYFGRLIKKSGDAKVIRKLKSDSEGSPLDWQTDDTIKTRENSEEDSMYIDETEKSKYLHRFSLFKWSYVKYFIMEMNYFAREEYKWASTFLDSPHGMMNRFNTSTAWDIAKLSAIALNNPNFSKIVKTKRHKWYSHKPLNFDEENPCTEFTPKFYCWENTNKLLWRGGYTGLKTGITQSAGPCLAASYKWELNKEFYIIVVLNSRSMDHRWNEVNKLKAWTSTRMKKIKNSNLFVENPGWERRILTKIRHL